MHYVDAFGQSGSASASVTVISGTDLEALTDDVAGQVWRAPFEPLRTIQVAVGLRLDDGRPVTAQRFYVRHRDEARLQGPLRAPSRPGPVTARAGGALAVGLAAVLGLTGCSLGGSSERKAARQRNEIIASVLEERLTGRPGVASIEMEYVDVSSQAGSAIADVVGARGTDLEAMADQLVGELWRAPFEPLPTIRVRVQLAGDPSVATERLYVGQRDQALLRGRYGTRPTPAQRDRRPGPPAAS